MAIVTQDHLIQSIADAFQYISSYHPPDFIRAMSRAYEKEESGAARNAIALPIPRLAPVISKRFPSSDPVPCMATMLPYQ